MMLWIYVLHAPGETLRTSGSSSESQNLNTCWYNECCAALKGGKYLSCNCTGISHETPECSRIHCYNLCRSSSMFNTLITRAARYVSKRSRAEHAQHQFSFIGRSFLYLVLCSGRELDRWNPEPGQYPCFLWGQQSPWAFIVSERPLPHLLIPGLTVQLLNKYLCVL